MKKITYLLSLLVSLSITFTFSAYASNKDVDAKTYVVDSGRYTIDYAAITKELNILEETLKSDNVEAKTISKYVSYLGTTRTQVLESKKLIEEELKNVNRRLESLGETPKEGEEELPIIAEKRKEYSEELIYQKGRVAENDLLINRIEELTSLIIAVRKKALIGNLLVYQEPLIYPSNIFKATGQFLDFSFNMMKSPVSWYLDLSPEQVSTVHSNVLLVLLSIVLFLMIGIFLRLMIIKHLGYRKDITEIPHYFTRVIAAFFVACAYGVIPAVLLGGFLLWMIHTKILAIGLFGLVLSSVLYYSLLIFLGNAVVRVVFAPYNSKWRLVNMDDIKAKRVAKVFYFSFFMIGITSMISHIAAEANYTLELVYFLSFISCTVKALCIVLIIKRFFWDEATSNAIVESIEHDPDDEDANEADSKARSALRVLFLTVIFATSVIGISLFGYPRLAEFIVNRFMLSILIISGFSIVRKAIFELLKKIFLFNFWVKTLRVRRQLIEKLDFWLNVIIDPIFVVFALLALLSLWGVSTDLMLQSIKKLFLGFKVGGVEISLAAILFGIVIFFISLSVVKLLRRKLFENILSHLEVDEGIKHSLAAGFGFVGFVLSTFLAIAVMGGDLSNIALVAGALSVGIGFGLQNVVNNFVSGIILLFERPVKVGDWVIINGEEGKIKQINIRSTELETFKRSSVIIPNANLISNQITNLTHGDAQSRLSVKVGVAYGTNVERVTEILLEVAKANKRVLKNPAPNVVFVDFAASSLDFEVRCYTNDIWTGWSIPSEMRYEIIRRFGEEEIEIPFAQMVLHHSKEERNIINHKIEKTEALVEEKKLDEEKKENKKKDKKNAD